ncbi:DEKNAAC104321 [Brettanomyces naardenensis]|uniref:DEKNAAC104321 n=1 Tax=Brettanomyces naardenensis TaxID=13370 RepID=A0A448YQM6_BRENA|nr:DEKNAAC104321 [Brettanomyces naardenensis]
MKDSDKAIDYDILEDSLEDYGSVFDPDGAILSESNSAKRYPNFWWIELSLFANVFLSGFDGTVTASTYTTIGDEFNSTNTAS